MAEGSRGSSTMLATDDMHNWRSRFLRITLLQDQMMLPYGVHSQGPYTPTIITTPVVSATENFPAVPEQTTVETVMNMTPENRAHFESEKEVIHLILTGIGDGNMSKVDACSDSSEMSLVQFTSHDWRTFESLLHKILHDDDEMIRCKFDSCYDAKSMFNFFNNFNQIWSKIFNELCAERMAKNANPLALVATAQTLSDPYYQSSKPHKSYAPTSKASLPPDLMATTKIQGKEIAKPIHHI
ncbi:hypothetical protein Tco_0398365 [Tanacetum coccineum]